MYQNFLLSQSDLSIEVQWEYDSTDCGCWCCVRKNSTFPRTSCQDYEIANAHIDLARTRLPEILDIAWERQRESEIPFFTIWYTSLMLQLRQRSECGGNSSHRETHRLSKLWLGTGSSGPCASVSGMLRGRKGGQYRCAVSWTTERKRRAHSRSRFCDWTSARSMGPTHFCNVIKRTV